MRTSDHGNIWTKVCLQDIARLFICVIKLHQVYSWRTLQPADAIPTVIPGVAPAEKSRQQPQRHRGARWSYGTVAWWQLSWDGYWDGWKDDTDSGRMIRLQNGHVFLEGKAPKWARFFRGERLQNGHVFLEGKKKLHQLNTVLKKIKSICDLSPQCLVDWKKWTIRYYKYIYKWLQVYAVCTSRNPLWM